MKRKRDSWKTLDGYKKFKAMVREKGFDLVASEEEWLSMNVQQKTNLQFRCQTSGTIVDNVQIYEF